MHVALLPPDPGTDGPVNHLDPERKLIWGDTLATPALSYMKLATPVQRREDLPLEGRFQRWTDPAFPRSGTSQEEPHQTPAVIRRTSPYDQPVPTYAGTSSPIKQPWRWRSKGHTAEATRYYRFAHSRPVTVVRGWGGVCYGFYVLSSAAADIAITYLASFILRNL